MIRWGKEVPEDLFLNWSSSGHKHEWATIFCNDIGWYHYWEYPHPKDSLDKCLEDAAWLLDKLMQENGKNISVTVCQI